MPSWKDIREHEVTDERWFLPQSVIQSAALGLAPAIAAETFEAREVKEKMMPFWLTEKIERAILRLIRTTGGTRAFEIVSGYNNFYEFGTDKCDPASERILRALALVHSVEGG